MLNDRLTGRVPRPLCDIRRRALEGVSCFSGDASGEAACSYRFTEAAQASTRPRTSSCCRAPGESGTSAPCWSSHHAVGDAGAAPCGTGETSEDGVPPAEAAPPRTAVLHRSGVPVCASSPPGICRDAAPWICGRRSSYAAPFIPAGDPDTAPNILSSRSGGRCAPSPPLSRLCGGDGRGLPLWPRRAPFFGMILLV